ncbi:MAG: molecular chaperone Tir [Methylothermaceae bacteria B42]|nr:MAG: molecular chaperone Tir [Methylothermaceae bacteria B42]HFD33191.1 toll/interleukin-1 receptor domain-containing protein [Gammaproteobacteria bacterium]
MPVFISYSHADELIVNKLAAHLVKHNASVWVDTWELNVGDSILNRVQDAIQESSALLVILSKTSVESEWCKKELSAGLMRELDEKRVVVLPVLVEDCEIPIFLREKMYADLRTDFDRGLHQVLDAIAKVTNSYQGRLEQDEGTVDWSEDWGYNDGLFHLRFTIVNSPNTLPMTFLTQIYVFCNEVATSRYKQYEAAGLDWIGRAVIAEALFDFGEKDDYRLILDNQFPRELKATIYDPKTGSKYDVICESRKMGQDNGKDQLVNISDYLKQIREYIRSVSRKPTPEEVAKIQKIIATPWNA